MIRRLNKYAFLRIVQLFLSVKLFKKLFLSNCLPIKEKILYNYSIIFQNKCCNLTLSRLLCDQKRKHLATLCQKLDLYVNNKEDARPELIGSSTFEIIQI